MYLADKIHKIKNFKTEEKILSWFKTSIPQSWKNSFTSKFTKGPFPDLDKRQGEESQNSLLQVK